MSGESGKQEVWYPAATTDMAIKAEVRAAVSAAGEVVGAGAEDDPAGPADLEETMVVKYVPLPAPAEPAAPAVVAAPAAALTAEQVGRHIARAEALAELGRRRQALDVLNELIVAGTHDVRVWRALAAVYLETGDGEKALRAADWVVTFAPGDEWGYRLRASALRLLDRPDEAVAAAEQAVRLGPRVWQSRASLAAALEASGDLSQAAEQARRASEMAAELDPEAASEAREFEEAVAKAFEESGESGESKEAGESKELRETPESIGLVADLEAVLASRPGPDDDSLAHVGNLVLRSMEFSAAAGWLVAFGGVAIPGFDTRFLIPLAVVLVLGGCLIGPARKAGRDLWRYLVEYLWQDTKTRVALLMTIAAHVFMITGSSLGHVQGSSTLTVGLISHLVGRLTLHRKAPELNPVRRGGTQKTARAVD